MPNGDPQPETNKTFIFIVIATIAVCTFIGVCTFAYCMVFHVNPDGVIVTAFSSIVTGCLGYLAGVLSKTSPTESTKQISVSNQPVITADDPNKPKT